MARKSARKTVKSAARKTARKVARKAARKMGAGAAKRPAAKRGRLMAFTGGHSHPEDHICACDLVFSDTDMMPDDMLPAARGGVEGSA